MGHVYGGESCSQWCIVSRTIAPIRMQLRNLGSAKYHKLRLTWFTKLRPVDPPNTDNVCVRSEHFTGECFIVDMQAAMGSKKTKRSLTKDAVPTLFSFNKLPVPRVLSERPGKRAEKNRLVAYHTDSLLIIIIEINIIWPDLNLTCQYCSIFTYMLVYVT